MFQSCLSFILRSDQWTGKRESYKRVAQTCPVSNYYVDYF